MIGEIRAAVQSRVDSWVNTLTGMGNRRDKATYTRFGGRPLLDPDTLDMLYVQSGLAARIVDQLVDDATREKYTVGGADEKFDWKRLRTDLDDTKADVSAATAWRWSRLHGAALLMPLIDDGGIDTREPLDKTKIRAIRGYEIIESRYAVPQLDNYSSVLNPSLYSIITRDRQHALTVHRSRVYRFNGVQNIPRGFLLQNRGWGPSVMERVYDELKGRGESFASSRSIMHTISQPVLKIKGFRKQITGTDGAKREIADIIDRIQRAASIMGWVTIDAEDEFGIIERTVEGLTQLLDKNVDALVHVSDGMPREILLGETPASLNIGELAGPFRAWYDRVRWNQESVLAPCIDWILDLMFSLYENGGQTRPTEWQVKFNPLWQESKKEQVDNDHTNAKTDEIYYRLGAVNSDEIRKARFVNKADIEIDEEDEADTPPLELPDPPDADPESASESPDLDVQDEALNGAQMNGLIETARAVRAGDITPEDAEGIIVLSFPKSAERARALIQSLAKPKPANTEEEESASDR
jgi:uncharacterized protein